MGLYFTSDLHLLHDKEFVYADRGFDDTISCAYEEINNINEDVSEDDDLYIAGDLILNNTELGIELLKKIKCKNIHIVFGNHDTETRREAYKSLSNVVETGVALECKFGKYRFYISHYPTITACIDGKKLSAHLINLYGHTHQNDNFYENNPFMYHIGLDSHNNRVIKAEDIIEEIKTKYIELLNERNSEER